MIKLKYLFCLIKRKFANTLRTGIASCPNKWRVFSIEGISPCLTKDAASSIWIQENDEN